MKNKRKSNQKRIISEDFKKEKVKLIDSGKSTVSEIATLYDLDYVTVYNWRKKYGILESGDRIVLEKDSDYQKVKDLTSKIIELERFIGRQQIQLDYYKTLISQVKEKYGDNLEKDFF